MIGALTQPLARALAFTPLVDPLPALYPGMSDYWIWLLLPLVIAIAVVYKGTRVADLRDLPRAAGVLIVQILAVMAVAAVALNLIYLVIIHYT